MSKRGPYNQHLYDKNKLTPKTTFYRQRRRGIYAWNIDYFTRRRNLNQIFTENTNTTNNNQETNENEVITVNNSNDQSYECAILNDEDDNSEIFQNLLSANNEAVTLETKCAILLTAFFNGKMSQSCFKTFLKAINCFAKLEVPSTFDGVANILLRHEEQNIISNKKFYCYQCKKFQEIHIRFERNCIQCDERLVFL